MKLSWLTTKLTFLRQDFVGIHFDVFGIIHFVQIILIVCFLFLLMFFAGKKIVVLLVQKNESEEFQTIFASFAIGYICIGTAILLLGMFSILTTASILVLILFLSIFAFYQNDFTNTLRSFLNSIKKSLFHFNWERAAFIFFILIVFLRLLPPDIESDALDYHTEYPRTYINMHTMMLPPVGSLTYTTIPQLAEMLYTLTESVRSLDAARYIHFGFFILTALLLYCLSKKHKETRIFLYAPYIFMASPILLHIAPSAYGDIQAMYCFLISAVMLTSQKKPDVKKIILAGLLFGGVLGTKIWGLIFYPVFFSYFLIYFRKQKFIEIIKYILYFTFSSLAVGSLWYLRSFILARSFFYFAYYETQKQGSLLDLAMKIFKHPTFPVSSLIHDFFPLLFVGTFALIFGVKSLFKSAKKLPIIYFALLSTIYIYAVFFILNNRYFSSMLPLEAMLASIGLFYLSQWKLLRFVLYAIFGAFALYYFVNSLLILPYGLGWTNKDAYLTRALLKDTAAYYDFGHQFGKWISPNETVATFGIIEHYYGNFNYLGFYVFPNKNLNFYEYLKARRINKLLIRGGDIDWFCENFKLENCTTEKYILLAKYDPAKQYLYKLSR